MFVKNYYIYCLRENIFYDSSDYGKPFKMNTLSGSASIEEYKQLRYPNGDYPLATQNIVFNNTSNGVGIDTVRDSNSYTTILCYTTKPSNLTKAYTYNSSNSAISSNYYEGYNRPIFRVGSGLTGDTTPVSLDDYKVDNMLFDDVISITQKLNMGGTYTLNVGNITASDVTIRQIGAYVVPGRMNKDYYDTTNDPFNVVDFSESYSYFPCLLIWKVKLTTPIVIPANGSKNITVEFTIPQ